MRIRALVREAEAYDRSPIVLTSADGNSGLLSVPEGMKTHDSVPERRVTSGKRRYESRVVMLP